MEEEKGQATKALLRGPSGPKINRIKKNLALNLTFGSLEGAKAKSEMLSDRKPSFVVLCLIPVLVNVMTDEKITRG